MHSRVAFSFDTKLAVCKAQKGIKMEFSMERMCRKIYYRQKTMSKKLVRETFSPKKPQSTPFVRSLSGALWTTR
jgi:hypothetical protein